MVVRGELCELISIVEVVELVLVEFVILGDLCKVRGYSVPENRYCGIDFNFQLGRDLFQVRITMP